MLSNSLQPVAEEYLYTDDNSVRVKTKLQLISAGANAIEPLINALIVTIHKFSSSVMGKKEIDNFFREAQQRLGLSEASMSELREKHQDVPELKGPGISTGSIMQSCTARDYAWQIVSQIGKGAIDKLFTFINGKDKLMQLTALFVLSAEEKQSPYIISLLVTSKPYHKKISFDLMERTSHELAHLLAHANPTTSVVDKVIYLIVKSKK